MFQTRDRYDGILFVVRGDEAPSTSRELPDGSVSVDIRPEVPVPSLDTDIWDEANCQDAFDALAQATSTEHYPEIAPGLAFIELTLDEFTRWLRGRGYVIPSFWNQAPEPPASAAAPLDATQMSRTGAAGRPSVMHLVKLELERRVKNGEITEGCESAKRIAQELAEWYENGPRKERPNTAATFMSRLFANFKGRHSERDG